MHVLVAPVHGDLVDRAKDGRHEGTGVARERHRLADAGGLISLGLGINPRNDVVYGRRTVEQPEAPPQRKGPLVHASFGNDQCDFLAGVGRVVPGWQAAKDRGQELRRGAANGTVNPWLDREADIVPRVKTDGIRAKREIRIKPERFPQLEGSAQRAQRLRARAVDGRLAH